MLKIINEGQGHLKEYMEGVEFRAVVSRYDNCECNGCFRCAKVTKISIPHTLYHNGRKLSTQYEYVWLCKECLGKLKEAIEHPTEEWSGNAV